MEMGNDEFNMKVFQDVQWVGFWTRNRKDSMWDQRLTQTSNRNNCNNEYDQ